MQESEEKKVAGKHVAPEPTAAPPEEDVLRTDADLYGDETDLPLKTRKSAAKKKKSSVKKRQRKKKKNKNTLWSRLVSLAPLRRKRQSLFEIMRGENSSVRPIRVFGREIRFWPLILLALVVMLVGMVFLNNSNVSVVQQEITAVGLSADLENYRILVISDLNGKRFGDKQSALLRAINGTSYNAVVCLGDMVGKGGDPEPFYELLEGIPSSKKVFFIAGDNDPGPFVETPRAIEGTLSQLVLEDWILGAIERGAVYVDSPVCLTIGSSNLWLTPATLMNLEAADLTTVWKEQAEQETDGVLSGLQADYDTLPITSYRQRIADNFYAALSSMKDDDFYLTLAHEMPSETFILASAAHTSDSGRYMSAPDLLLAGHYGGGVWRLPLLGAFYIPDSTLPRNGWFPAQERVQGLSAVGETQVYITGGLSINGDLPLMRFRLMNQPQISVLTLSATLPESMLSAE